MKSTASGSRSSIEVVWMIRAALVQCTDVRFNAFAEDAFVEDAFVEIALQETNARKVVKAHGNE